ncbi:MAG: redoxin domain-containing protein [Acidobacteriota bacterium]|nr:redoxin domain-containing protein [Acidobacteriota bacterium]
MMKWLARVVLVIGGLYATLFAVVGVAMMQTPVRFGAFMKRMPPALVWGLLPAQQMWLRARAGNLEVGQEAPDFTLPRQDRKGSVRLSEHRGSRPVVLVFGSYT